MTCTPQILPDDQTESRATASAPGRVLVTGASGFVGRMLCLELVRRGFPVRAAVRDACAGALPDGVECIAIGSIAPDTDWSAALDGVSIVIHLAARVHVMDDRATDPLAEFRKVNAEGSERLARQAAANGVKRLVFVSSIKVNGEMTEGEAKFSESDPAAPEDAYGRSKWEGEQALWRVARETGLEGVVVRPPLVYGPAVKGNFASLLGVLRRRLPLPLASVRNRRSLIYVGNLVDALIRCATHSAAAMQTYLVCDGDDLSTSDLLRRLGQTMGKPALLLPFPTGVLRLAGKVTGKSAAIGRLLGSLRVDDRKIRRELGWTPPYSVAEGFRATVE